MSIHSLHPNARDRSQVEVLAGMGATPEFIAKHLNLTTPDLEQYYSKELRFGAEEANIQVAKTFHELAVSGEHPAMTLAWLKLRAGWTESPSTREEEDVDNVIEEARSKLTKLLNRGK